jgi:hypothetical protein
MGNYPFGANPALILRAATPLAGFPLVNGTPNILTWTAPADGQMHTVFPVVVVHVTSQETGGNINVGWTTPDGASFSATPFFGGASAGVYQSNNLLPALIEAGTTFTISQSSALTGGAAVVFAAIWGGL